MIIYEKLAQVSHQKDSDTLSTFIRLSNVEFVRVLPEHSVELTEVFWHGIGSWEEVIHAGKVPNRVTHLPTLETSLRSKMSFSCSPNVAFQGSEIFGFDDTLKLLMMLRSVLTLIQNNILVHKISPSLQ